MLVSLVSVVVVLVGWMLWVRFSTSKCSECGGRVVSQAIGLNIQMTQCKSCGVEKTERTP